MAEDRRFFAHARVAELRWLGLLDAPLRRLGVSNVFAAPVEAGDIAAVRRALEPLLSPSVCLLVPMAFGGHLDHRVACAFHAEGRCRLVFYEDLPYAGFMPMEAVGEAVFLLEERLRAPASRGLVKRRPGSGQAVGRHELCLPGRGPFAGDAPCTWPAARTSGRARGAGVVSFVGHVAKLRDIFGLGVIAGRVCRNSYGTIRASTQASRAEPTASADCTVSTPRHG